MKTKIIPIIVLTVSAFAARAQWVVSDPAVLAQTLVNTYLGQSQLQTIENQLTTTTTLVNQIGNPAAIKQVAGASGVLQSLKSAINSATLSQIQSQCTGTATLTNTGNGIYQPISSTITAPDGTAIPRQANLYKPADAVDQVTAYCEAVQNDTETRRTALLQQIKATTDQVQSAQTVAEVQKLQVVAAAQNAALSSIDAERLAALSTVLVQQAQNQSDQQRQQQAQAESRAVDFHYASKKAFDFLTPSATALAIPQSGASALRLK